MKKVMLIVLAGMFSLSMFAQTQEKAKPAEPKKEPAKTEVAKPATKNAKKNTTKEAAKPAEKKDVSQPKK